MATKRDGVPEYEKAELDEPLLVRRAENALAPTVADLYALGCSMKGLKEQFADARKFAQELRR